MMSKDSQPGRSKFRWRDWWLRATSFSMASTLIVLIGIIILGWIIVDAQYLVTLGFWVSPAWVHALPFGGSVYDWDGLGPRASLMGCLFWMLGMSFALLVFHTCKRDGKLAVCIEVVARNSKVYYIVAQDDQGQQVSRFRMDAKETVVAAVLKVEGLAAIAANDGVWIARQLAGNIHTLDVDWRAITQEGRLETNHTLRPGDRIYLGQSPSKSRM